MTGNQIVGSQRSGHMEAFLSWAVAAGAGVKVKCRTVPIRGNRSRWRERRYLARDDFSGDGALAWSAAGLRGFRMLDRHALAHPHGQVGTAGHFDAQTAIAAARGIGRGETNRVLLAQ